MIKDLYINEKIIISLDKTNHLNGLIIKEYSTNSLDSKEIEFIRSKASVMDKLKEENKLDIITDGTTITSSIKEDKGVGFTIPSSIENLEFNLNAKRR